MEYILYVIIIAGTLLFLLIPFIRGTRSVNYFQETDKVKKKKEEKEQSVKDNIESTKLALRDLDMENKIGKISNEDYEILKDELLEEWKSAENEYKQIKSK